VLGVFGVLGVLVVLGVFGWGFDGIKYIYSFTIN